MKVDIWSDIACPWCYVGKRRFEKALAHFPHRDAVEVTWRAFELDPSAPAGPGQPHQEHLAAKYQVSAEQAGAMVQQMAQTAAAEGLTYRPEIARTANSFDAHRLLHLARARGVYDAVHERLFAAYFSNGEAIGDRETLITIALETGLDGDEARAVLEGDAYAEDVRTEEATARSLGISGVPFFVFDRSLGVSGAQSPDVLLEVLSQAWEQAHPLTMVGGNAEQCADGSCA